MRDVHDRLMKEALRSVLFEHDIINEKLVGALMHVRGASVTLKGKTWDTNFPVEIDVEDKGDLVPIYDNNGNRHEGWTTFVRIRTGVRAPEDCYIQVARLDVEREGCKPSVARNKALKKYLFKKHINLDAEVAA